jgi:hypothetical protein
MFPKIKYAMSDFEVPSTKQKIKMRQMLAREEKILLMAKSAPEDTEEQRASKAIDIQNAVKQIINNCIVTSGVDINKLALFDLEYLYLRLRGFSTSNIVKVTYTDREDERDYNFEIDLNKLEIKWPEKATDQIKVDDTIVLNLRYPNASLYTNKDFLEAKTGGEAAELLFANCIKNVADGGNIVEVDVDKPEEWKEFLNGLPISTYTTLYDYIFNMPKVYHELNYQNASGKDRKIVLQSLADFFMFL